MYVSLYEEPHLYTKKKGLDVMQSHPLYRTCLYVCRYVRRFVGCCLATKSLTLNKIKYRRMAEWVEVIVGVALGC